ncbi:Restriction endonuclease subunit R [Helicobacter burdigaliensis]
MTLQEILKDSDYKLDLFNKDSITKLESKITAKTNKNNQITYHINCLIRDKEIKLTPEEIVRQLYIDKLLNEYNYPTDMIKVEFGVHFGREVKRADIVIMDKIQITTPYIIIEVKKPKLKDGKNN